MEKNMEIVDVFPSTDGSGITVAVDVMGKKGFLERRMRKFKMFEGHGDVSELLALYLRHGILMKTEKDWIERMGEICGRVVEWPMSVFEKMRDRDKPWKPLDRQASVCGGA